MALSFERYVTEIVAQTALLGSYVKGADMSAPVPSCPDWNLGQLVRHLGGAHRWAETIMRTRATEPVSDEVVNDVPRRTGEDADALVARLADRAAALADSLRAAGPDTPVWTVAPGGTPVFWARRMTHETAVHRSDAALATGAEFTLVEAVAADGLDEWMGFGTLPEAYESASGLLGPGHTLHFHATDTAADWLVDLTGHSPVWRRTHEEAAVTVRGPVAGLLLLLYRRPAEGVDVEGDTALLDTWLDHTGFWLE